MMADILDRDSYTVCVDGWVPLIDAARRAGITYRQADYWRTHGWIDTEYRTRCGRPVDTEGTGFSGSGYTSFIHLTEVRHLLRMTAMVKRGLNPNVAADLSDRLGSDGIVELGGGLYLGLRE